MDIVIPLGKSRIDFLDLRYVLRSIDKFTTPRDIYIVGEKPKWLTGVKHISDVDNPNKQWKERNIYHKTVTAFAHTGKFMFMNDDHVFIQETDIENYPNYYKGTCYLSMLKNGSHYRQTMNQTKKWLEGNGYTDINFDGHCPIIFEKERFFNTVDKVDWSKPYGYGMKSIYAAGLDGVHMPDCKMHTALTFKEAEQRCQDRHVISFTDGAIKSGLGEYLKTIFPNKSKYEA